MPPSQYGYNLPPPSRGPSPSYDQKVAETYNGGNGFTPIKTNTRNSQLFQNSSDSSSNANTRRPDYANGGAAAGRSCLVVPSFGSGKKKKKKEKKDTTSPVATPTPKKKGGAFFGKNNFSGTDSVSTSAESSMPDPYQVYYSNRAEKQSLLKSFSKKQSGGNKDAREWYLETMVEVDETADQDTNHNKINISNQPLQFRDQQPQRNHPQSYSQFTPQFTPQQRQTNNPNFGTTNFDSNSPFGPPTTPSDNGFPDLLQLPPVENRGHDARKNQGRMHAYDGEMEPEGVRGQEAKINTVNNNGNSQHSTPIYDGPGSSPYFSTPQPFMRDFAKSNASENSSQLLPIHQVVNNRQRNTMRIAQPETKPKKPTIQAKYSPGYEERMNIASNVLGGGRLPPQQPAVSDYSGFEEDIEHEEMISNNRAEFEQEFRQQAQNRQAHERLNLQQQQDQLRQINQKLAFGSPNARSQNASTMSDDLGSFDTPSRTSRKSAPVNIDDASFEKPLEHIQGIHAMAMEHVTKGEFDMALQAFQEVLKVYLKEHGPAHPLTASAHHNLGTVHTKRAGLLPEHTLHQRHCREQALQCFQAAARSARDCQTLGPNHPNVAVSLVRIGFLLLQARQYKNAVITFEEALRIRTENYGLYHGLVANLFNNLGVCHMHLQQFSEGRKQLQQALDIQKELLVQEGEDSSTALLELADTLCNIGGLNLEWIRRQGPDARRALDAENAFVEAIRLRSKVLGEDHTLTNQVRSLHDMVRSLPMPTAVEKTTPKPATRSPNRAPPSWTSASTTSKQQQQHMGDFSPVAISDMTKSSAGRTEHSARSMAESLDESAVMNDKSGLNLPALKNHDQKTRSEKANGNKPQHFMDLYDRTEESWVLRKPQDDETSSAANQPYVSYARSTVSMGSESNQESDRAATMRQAKEMLDAHQDFMYSPNSNPTRTPSGTERTIEDRDGNAYEDGLVPLAGDWPGPRDTNRLSPICLKNPTRNLHTIHNCAVSYMARGRHTEAVALLEMVVECQKQKYGALHANVGSAVHNVGIAYLGGEVHYKAFQAFEEAVRIRKAALGRSHPVVAVSLVKFGISLMLLQRHEDSLWIFRDALAIRKESLGDLHPSNARIYNNIGCVHVELDELEEARKVFEAALDIQRNALIQNSENGPMIFGASTTLQNLGYLYGKRELYEKAAMVLRESLSVSQSCFIEISGVKCNFGNGWIENSTLYFYILFLCTHKLR